MTSTPPPEPASELQPVHKPRGVVNYPPPFLPGPLPCPRCISTDTKFCYYNNYNLSQPRHYCKTCRRHWTHGGVLRDVPVGGASRIKKLPTKQPRLRKNRSSSSSASTSTSTPTSSITHEYDHTPPISEVSASDKHVSRNDVIEPMNNIGDGGFLSLMNSPQEYEYGSTLFSGGYVSGYGSGLANGFLQGFGAAAAAVWGFQPQLQPQPQQVVGDVASVNAHAFGAFASVNDGGGGGGGAPAAAPSGLDTWQMGGALAYHESQGGLKNGTGNDCYAWPELQMSSSNSVPVGGGVNEKVVPSSNHGLNLPA